ncbi:MAG: hypothetical protein KBD55_02625 [Candidatus Pacebacteria bacterium]|jgi:hypothetical protein|nr:hypothetical protein [Candidatus Paceibacterota bacterium]
MYILFTLFILSLLSISAMIGRKLIVLRNGEFLDKEEFSVEVPIFEEMRYVTGKTVKKIGYVTLVTSMRLYFRSTNFVKTKYHTTKIRIKDLRNKNKTLAQIEDQKEISKFLQIISEYKGKIRTIKHKIREEEKGL